jgi:hypothetical protein
MAKCKNKVPIDGQIARVDGGSCASKVCKKVTRVCNKFYKPIVVSASLCVIAVTGLIIRNTIKYDNIANEENKVENDISAILDILRQIVKPLTPAINTTVSNVLANYTGADPIKEINSVNLGIDVGRGSS